MKYIVQASLKQEEVTVNDYACDQCKWEYVWRMGDRVKAVKAHRLAHLVGNADEPKHAEIDVPPYLMDDYIKSRRGVQWL